MSIGYSPETVGLIILGGFAAAVGVCLIYWLIRLLLRLVGVKKDDTWGFAIVAVAIAGTLFAASMALDTIGEHDSAVVTSKREVITVTRRGGWRRTTQVGVKTTSGGESQLGTLSASIPRYDRLVEGDTLQVRLLRYGGLSIMRDAETSTRTLVPWTWVVAGLLGVVLIVMLWKLMPSVLLVGGLLVALAYPLVQAQRDQAQADDASGKTATASAVVTQVTRVTEWHLGARRSRSGTRAFDKFVLTQPYDVVEMQFTPPGLRSAVLAVDAVDLEALATPLPLKGSTLTVRYAPADPRDVHIDGRTRSWHWRDMRGVYTESALVVVAVIAFFVAVAWFFRRGKRTR